MTTQHSHNYVQKEVEVYFVMECTKLQNLQLTN